MAYNEFAYFYDELNDDADYDTLFQVIYQQLQKYGVKDGILADFGCGTGDLTLMFAQAGYDVIGVDASEEMLSVFREKTAELSQEWQTAEGKDLSDDLLMVSRDTPAKAGLSGILLLHQDLLQLDLYGTIRAAVSTFDTLNHIGPLENFEKVIEKIAFFMEKGGVFIFDMNTPYKHQKVLANETFTLESADAICVWENHLQQKQQRTEISIRIEYQDTKESFEEVFFEYWYSLDQIKEICERYGLKVEQVQDGETFESIKEESQRWLITAVKQYTQIEREI